MVRASFDKTAMLYNFVEKHIWSDYSSACFIINEYLSLRNEEKIIDVGGGTGLVAKLLRSKTQNDDIIVIDLSRSMLKKVKDSTLTLIQGDVTAYPLKNETFTLAVLVNTIHHINETKQQVALHEVFRILKKQGRIFIIDIWYPNTFKSKFFINIEKLLVGKTHHLTPDEMHYALQDVGFQKIQLFSPKNYTDRYIAIAIK